MKKFLNGAKMTPLYTLLVVLSVVMVLVSNVIAGKSVPIFNLSVFGNLLTVNAGVITFPLSYILSSVFSEVYGYKHSRITCWMAFGCNLFMVLIFQLALIMPAAPWFDQAAFATILGTTPGLLAASLTAYVAGDWIKDIIFDKFKQRDGENGFALRALLSSFCGQAVDSIVFLPLLYWLTGQMGTTITAWYQLAAMVIIYAAMKTMYEALILPVTTRCVAAVRAYEAAAE